MFIAGITLFSGLILVIFSVTLYRKQSPLQKASRILAATFLLLACWIFSIVYLYSGMCTKSESLLSFYLPIDLILSLCIGPCIYFYVRTLFDGNRLQWKRQLPYHALPVVPSLFFLFYFAAIPSDERIAMLLNETFDDSWMFVGINGLFYTQSVSYFSLCFLKIKKQRASGYLLETDKQHTNIRWLMYLFIFAMTAVYIYIPFCMHEDSMMKHIFMQMCLIDLVILYLLIQSVWFTGLSMHSTSAIPSSNGTELTAPSTSRLNINELQAQIILQKLNEVLETQQLYLSKKCSLQQVASCSGIPAHRVSRAINGYSECNFTDIINKYRVEHICRILQNGQSQKLKLDAIGIECGFGSKANFYAEFKKFTGKTPARYLDDLDKFESLPQVEPSKMESSLPTII